jgi:hypothetical protein
MSQADGEARRQNRAYHEAFGDVFLLGFAVAHRWILLDFAGTFIYDAWWGDIVCMAGEHSLR